MDSFGDKVLVKTWAFQDVLGRTLAYPKLKRAKKFG